MRLKRAKSMNHAIGFVLLTAALMFASPPTSLAEAAGEPAGVPIQFHNCTDATIRIDAIVGHGQQPTAPKTVKPHSMMSVSVAPGRRIFELIALRARPVRIHRIAISVPKNKGGQFYITPQMMGLYLEDADSLAAIATIATGPSDELRSLSGYAAISDRCQSAMDSLDRLIIWTGDKPSTARHYPKSGRYICSVDGRDAFYQAETYQHFTCSIAWQDCLRQSNGDAIPVPIIRTSDTLDPLLRSAVIREDVHLASVRTQLLEWVRGETPASRMTTYSAYFRPGCEDHCPQGYRLHYQGLCINTADEVSDNAQKGVRMTYPAFGR